MPVPKYDDFMLPILSLLSDGSQRTRKEIADLAADRLHVSSEDRLVLLPSGRARLYQSRSGWAVTYLSQAKLLNRIDRGMYQLSDRGRSVLAGKPASVGIPLLKQFPEFVAFQGGNVPDEIATRLTSGPNQPATDELTPPEQIHRAFELWKSRLADDLLTNIKEKSPEFFEFLVVELLLKMGYGDATKASGRVLGGSGDGGIDGVINGDRLGLDSIYIQAKRWEGPVGRPPIQQFVGSLAGRGASKGVFITTSTFAVNAREYVKTVPNHKIVLVDGEMLSELCIEFGVGVQPMPKATYTLMQIDRDFFGYVDDDDAALADPI